MLTSHHICRRSPRQLYIMMVAAHDLKIVLAAGWHANPRGWWDEPIRNLKIVSLSSTKIAGQDLTCVGGNLGAFPKVGVLHNKSTWLGSNVQINGHSMEEPKIFVGDFHLSWLLIRPSPHPPPTHLPPSTSRVPLNTSSTSHSPVSFVNPKKVR